MKIIKNSIVYVIAFCILVVIGLIFIKMPVAKVIELFRPNITQTQLDQDETGNLIGRIPTKDVIKAKSIHEIRQTTNKTTNKATDYKVVETTQIIATKQYKLKNPYNTEVKKNQTRRTRTRENYTTRPQIYEQYLYGQYYLLELEDGKHIMGFMDQSYATLNLEKDNITLPIGKLVLATSNEKEWMKQWQTEYGFDDTYILWMHNQNETEQFELLDIIIRIGAIGLFLITGCLLLVIINKLGSKKH